MVDARARSGRARRERGAAAVLRFGRGSSALVVLLGLAGWAAGQSQTADTANLGESVPRGEASRVRIEMKAQGLFRPPLPPDRMTAGAKMPKPVSLDVQTRLIFS